MTEQFGIDEAKETQAISSSGSGIQNDKKVNERLGFGKQTRTHGFTQWKGH